MKKNIFTIIVLFACIQFGYATQWTVSNDPTRPAQFTLLEDAISAALPGDTLLIAGSSTTYPTSSSSFTIYKPLVYIGEGANNPDGYNTSIKYIKLKNNTNGVGPSGSRFYGIRFTQYLDFEGNFTGQATGVNNKLENIVFERCSWNNGYYPDFSNGFFNNIVFNNCVFNQNKESHFSSPGPYSGIEFNNCINPKIYGNSSHSFNGGLSIKNSIFLNFTEHAFNYTDSILVENCIFYTAEPTGASNSVFNNCITYICNNGGLPYGTNAGTGNLINIDPQFIDYPSLAVDFSWSHNYGLQNGSPAIGAGTGGTNIGLTGGTYPVNNIPGNSHSPVVTEVTMPNSSVPLNGTLQGNIKAKVRN